MKVFEDFMSSNGYITPILIVFGVTGNIMNLTVLMTPSLRTKSNVLLSALAISDCFFLILMFPHSLGQYDFFAMNYNFRYFYFHCRMHLIAFANFFSAAAIWLVLAICMERLIGIKYPLFVRRYGMKSSFYIIGGIIGATFIVTAYSHISYKCLIKHFCSNTQIHSMCFSAQRDKWTSKLNNTYSDLAKQYVTWNTRFNAVFVVFLPILVVLWANVLLLMTLRERQKFMERSNVKQGEMGRAQMLMEQKITITVCAIVTSFTITQGPSALALLLSDFLLANSNKITTQMTIFPQFLVVLGKSLNFGLFCLSSAGFRTKLLSISKHRFTNWKPSRSSRYMYEPQETVVTTTGNGLSECVTVDVASRTCRMSLRNLIPNKKNSLPNYMSNNINDRSRHLSLPNRSKKSLPILKEQQQPLIKNILHINDVFGSTTV